jgi:uncharacterized membrane protein
MFWLPLLLVTLPVPLLRVMQDPGSRTSFRVSQVATVPAVLLLAWVIVLSIEGGSIGDAVSARGWNWLSSLFIAGAFCVTALALWRAAETREDEEETAGLVPMLAMTAVATMLILGAELFYIDDVFNSRLNTVFKLYYQAWILLAAAGAFGAYWLLQHWQTERGSATEMLRGAWGGLATLVVLGALLYPLGATLSRTDGLARDARTLDGLAFVAQRNPAEIEAVKWVRTRAGQDEYIVEAVLGAYTGGARISGRSGVPAVIGWPSHETQWGRSGAEVQARVNDVDMAYTTQSLAQALEILRRYKVTYVVVGSVERAKYPAEGLQKFNSGLQSVYRNGDIVIYRMPIVPAGTQSDATGAAP